MLTRIPVGAGDDDDTGAAAYGLVGALVGAIAAIPVALLAGAAPTLAAILAVGTLAIISGGLHLDGLADTADALLAPDRMRAEAARKDPGRRVRGRGRPGPRAGRPGRRPRERLTTGGIADRRRRTCHRGAGYASRTLPVVVAWAGRRRAPRGRARRLVPRPVGPIDVAAAVLTTAAVTAIAARSPGPSWCPWPWRSGRSSGLAVAFGLVRARGQIDGDLLGATVEVGFAAIVGAMAVALNVAWPGL